MLLFLEMDHSPSGGEDLANRPQVVTATEGGHIDFAPLDSIEDAILARLEKELKEARKRAK